MSFSHDVHRASLGHVRDGAVEVVVAQIPAHKEAEKQGAQPKRHRHTRVSPRHLVYITSGPAAQVAAAQGPVLPARKR